MERFLSKKDYVKSSTVVLPISKGGTGASNPADAAVNLGAIPKSLLDMPGGIAALTVNSKIPVECLDFIPGIEAPSIKGLTNVYVGMQTRYCITNYDNDTVYTITVDKGTVTILTGNLEGCFDYTAPAEPGVCILTINHRNVSIGILPVTIAKPVITNPANNEVDVNRSPTFASAPVTFFGPPDPNIQYEWQLSSDPTFVTLIPLDAQNNVIDSLNIGQLYYLRLRINGQTAISSPWSNIVSFTTQAISLSIFETQIIHQTTDRGTTGQFGSIISLSLDETVLVLGDSSSNYFYIYKKISNVWTFQSELINNFYGDYTDIQDVIILADNQTMLVSVPGLNSDDENDMNTGGIYVLQTTITDDYSTLTLVGTIRPSVERPFSHFSSYMYVNDARTRLFAYRGGVIDIVNGTKDDILIFDITNGPLIQSGTVTETTIISGTSIVQQFNSFRTNAAGTRFVVTDAAYNGYAGAAQVYDFDGTDWSVTTTLYSDLELDETQFSWPLEISPDGNTILIGSYIDSAPDYNSKLYIFKYIGNIWTKVQIITNPTWAMTSLGAEPGYCRFTADNEFLLIGSNASSAVGDPDPNNGKGRVYIYQKNGANYVSIHDLTASDATANSEFGTQFVFGINYNEFIISSPNREWDIPETTGAVYIYQ